MSAALHLATSLLRWSRRRAIAVLQLLCTECTMISGFFLKIKPPCTELGPVNTTRADGVASENRARRGRVSPRRAVAPPLSRARTRYGPIFAVTRRDGADFSDFVVARRSSNPLQRAPRSSNSGKSAPVATALVVLTGPSCVQGGFFSRKKPLIIVLSVHSNWRTAINGRG